jgi:hypothetical protein
MLLTDFLDCNTSDDGRRLDYWQVAEPISTIGLNRLWVAVFVD